MWSLIFAEDTPETDSADVLPAPLQEMWDKAYIYIDENGLKLLMNVIAALVILIIGRWIAKIIYGLIIRAMARAKIETTLSNFLSSIAYYALMAVVLITALGSLGVETTSITAILATAGLAVGLALKDSLASFASGVMLILFKPFKIGDYVEAGGISGSVEQIHIFHTKLRTPDNKEITVPNSMVAGDAITNYSAKSTRRIDLVVGCGYNDDLLEVKQFLNDLIGQDDRILTDPEPTVAVDELADSSVNFVVRPWVNSADYWAVKWDLTEKIKVGFDSRGFNIPFPQQDVHMHQVG